MATLPSRCHCRPRVRRPFVRVTCPYCPTQATGRYPLKLASLEKDVPDLVMMDDLNEGLLLHTLKGRFREGAIYTACGESILVALNPYETVCDYSPATIAQYHRPGNAALPPHIFQVPAAAHLALMLTQKDQAVLISGESGAGKTEATKHTLSFLAEVCGSGRHALQQQLLSASRLLEAFGNAKTCRNK